MEVSRFRFGLVSLVALSLNAAACSSSDDEGAQPVDTASTDAGTTKPGTDPAKPSYPANPASDVQVSILSPKADALIDGKTFTINAKVSSARNLSSADLVVDGTKTPIDLSKLSEAGDLTLDVTGADGEHAIEIVAKDEANVEGSAKIKVSLDDAAPFVDMLSPRKGVETRRLLRATIKDAAGIKKVTVKLNDGAEVEKTVPAGATSFELSEFLPTVRGANTLTVTVEDGFGHSKTDTIPFNYGFITSGGGAHSGAILGGMLYMWGRNNVGQAGTATEMTDAASPLTPQRVLLDGDVANTPASIALNQLFSMAVTTTGKVYTWGTNTNGQLGTGVADTKQNVPKPVSITTTTSPVVYGVLGYDHALVLHDDGSVSAWGSNVDGQVGDGTSGTGNTVKKTPVAVAGLPTNIVKLIAGSSHSAALTATGDVWIWGANDYGQQGTGSADSNAHPVPAKIAALSNVVDIANGRDHLLALLADGTIKAWGLGAGGQLGLGETVDSYSPQSVLAGTTNEVFGNVAAVFANGNSSYALLKNGEYWGFGAGSSGQLAAANASDRWYPKHAGIVTDGTPPTYLDSSVEIQSFGIGVTHTIALTSTGAIYAWGWSFRGSLGVASLPNAWAQHTPVLVTMPAE